MIMLHIYFKKEKNKEKKAIQSKAKKKERKKEREMVDEDVWVLYCL